MPRRIGRRHARASGVRNGVAERATDLDALEVVQQGPTAYTVDQSAGTVTRIDGAAFDKTPPATPIVDARGPGLSVVAGPTALYTLDTSRGLLADTDPRTLDRRGGLMSVASEAAAKNPTCTISLNRGLNVGADVEGPH